MKPLGDQRSRHFNFLRPLVVGLFVLAGCAFPGAALATVFNVNTTTDSDAVSAGAGTGIDNTGHISLRSALEAADAVGGTHTVNVPAGTYNLSKGTINFGNNAQNITLVGAGAATTIVNMTATLQNRIFLIDPPGTIPFVTTAISGIQFTGGKLTGDNYGGGAIIAGGPTNSLTLTSCIFANNSVPVGNGAGGAVRYNGGGTLTINGCTFNNNSNADSVGGAVSYFLENLVSAGNGAVTITNSTFTGNSVTAGGGAGGGAIHLAAQGRITAGVTFVVSILRNTFTGNSASGASGTGGAIATINSFDVGNAMQVHYNRFFGNTATTVPNTLAVSSAQGSVNATDNWWGINTGPGTSAAITGSGGVGTLTVNTWLQLRHTANPNSLAVPNSTTLTATFLTNSAGTTIAAANLAGVPVFPITFNNAVRGTLSGAGTSIQSGTATATFTANAAGAGSADAVVDSQTVTAAITILNSVISINRVNLSPTNLNSVSWTVTFASAVSGVTSGNFSLVNTGLGGAPAITSVTAVGGAPATAWTVTASTGSGSGTLGLNMVNSSGVSTSIGNLTFTGQVYTIDLVAPSVNCSPDLNVTANGYCPPVVNFTVSVSDNLALSLATTNPASGSVFPLGTNTVTLTARDTAGNTNFCTFKVIVSPGAAPRLSIVNSGTNVVVSWTNSYPCYTFQFAPILASNSWTAYPGPFATNNGKIFVTNSPPFTNRFFRLSF